ncbi:MAG: hypothetical protein SNJ72_05305, partial [Fimbriimonadales bacterium]
SIAIPPLGCGLGGLRWQQVKPLIQKYLEPLQDVEVRVYEPSIVPPSVQEASFLTLLEHYSETYGFLTTEEMEQIAQIAGVLRSSPGKKRRKKNGEAQQKTPSFRAFLNQLMQKKLLVEYKEDKQKLYAVPPNIHPMIDEVLKQSAEWQEYTHKLADQIVALDSLESLRLFNQLHALKQDPSAEPYMEGVWQMLRESPAPPSRSKSTAKPNVK